jgi:Zn-dependent protease
MVREAAVWSISLGRWGGVQVRVHALFVLVALVALFAAVGGRESDVSGWSLLALGVLFASVVAHELGHCVAAVRLGGAVEEIILCPWGGLGTVAGPPHPQLQVVVAMTGPLVNLGLVLTSAALLLVLEREADVRGLLNPFHPRDVQAGGAGLTAVKLALATNWLLLMVNLLPALPLDCGRAVKSGLWCLVGYRRAALVTSAAGKLTALGLCLLAWALCKEAAGPAVAVASGPAPTALPPTWTWPAALAVLVYFSAKAELARLRENEAGDRWLGYELGGGFSLDAPAASPPPPQPGFLQRWLDRRRQARDSRRRLAEEQEEWRVDDILARLHEFGIQSLSLEDRAILERASARYRSRRRSVSEP